MMIVSSNALQIGSWKQAWEHVKPIVDKGGSESQEKKPEHSVEAESANGAQQQPAASPGPQQGKTET